MTRNRYVYMVTVSGGLLGNSGYFDNLLIIDHMLVILETIST